MTALNEASVELEVPFHDVDALRVVWHGHYYKYMEIARTKLLRERGLDGLQMLDLGYHFLVIESRCRYVFPLRYGETFRVTARFLDIDNRVNISYAIFNLSQGRRTAKGRTALATTDLEGKLLLETPEAVRSRLVA